MKVVIDRPTINMLDECYRRWSYTDCEARKIADQLIEDHNLNPDSHPKVIELCAGDGSVLANLRERGWNPENMTAVDKHISPDALVPCEWLYADLEKFDILLAEKDLKEINDSGLMPYRGQFDAGFLVQGHFMDHGDSWQAARRVTQFFVKEGGPVITTY